MKTMQLNNLHQCCVIFFDKFFIWKYELSKWGGVLFILLLWNESATGFPLPEKTVSFTNISKFEKKDIGSLSEENTQSVNSNRAQSVSSNRTQSVNSNRAQSVNSNRAQSVPNNRVQTESNFKATLPLETKDTIIYNLTVDYKKVNFTGKSRKAMVINNSLPAPTLYFKEGKKAIIHVTNKMDVETSIHWHGILLPNFQDGVPYLTTPPIRPGKTHKFEFTLRHSGTYWYHSHTGLQEQRGIYGAIVVEPTQKIHKYNHDLVLVLSDWTDENPNEVLRTLKRGDEWYAIKKGSALSLSEVIAQNAFIAQLKLWKQKMPGMDISDIYYDTFLINGKKKRHYSEFKAGETIRLRIINASASTYFQLGFGGKAPLLISADGMDIEPFPTKKILHAIAETYDFLITLPKKKAIEIKATAQDGSGSAAVTIGKGEFLKAPAVPKPDPAQPMKQMADMHRGEKHSTHNSHKKHSSVIHEKSHGNRGSHEGHGSHENHESHKSHGSRNNIHTMQQSSAKNNIHHKADQIHKLSGYDNLKALQKTSFSKTNTLRNIHFNLTGNMWRYIWSMNGKTLSRSDRIKIKKGETIRIHLHNTTMMHHPMHLHGHFFRVLNKQGERSPLKHTVDVPPMQTVVIEFNPDEKGDWFFHCHVLYHMKSGMSRVFSHGDNRDIRLQNHSLSTILNTDNQMYIWSEMNIMSNRLDWEIVTSNTRNKVMLEGTFSYVDDYYNFHKNLELGASHEYFISDFFRIYAEVEMENHVAGIVNKLTDMELIGKAGIRYLLPYFVEWSINLDHQMRLQTSLEYDLLLFPRTELFTGWEGTVDFGIINSLPDGMEWEQKWFVGLSYRISKSFSMTTGYDNQFSWGAGLNWKL